MTVGMEHRDERGHGTLCLQAPWSIVLKGVMEHCNERGHAEL